MLLLFESSVGNINISFFYYRLVKGYQKVNKFSDVISYFSTREWTFKNDNIQALWDRLNKNDRELFEFSMKNLNWEMYFYTYTRGLRVYLLKDPLDTIDKGAVKIKKLKIAHYTLIAVLTYLCFKLVTFILGLIFRM